MNRTHYGKVWFGFSVIFALVIVIVLPHPSVALTPKQLQIKNQILKDIKKIEAQKDILIKECRATTR